MLNASQIAEFEAFILELNRASGEVILPLFRAEHLMEDKGGAAGFDPVTSADRGAEVEIRRLISHHYPAHGVIGEEYGEDRPEAEFVWVLDPVDGTRAFISGLPLWTTLIGMRYQGVPALGSIGQPFLGEVYLGSPGCTLRIDKGGTTALKTRRGIALDAAIIATTDPEGLFGPGELKAWQRLRAATRLARLGCDAYAYAMVAAGTLDFVVESGLKTWDIDPAVPVITGAGGVVTDWRGQDLGRQGGQVIIAGDPDLLSGAVDALSAAAV